MSFEFSCEFVHETDSAILIKDPTDDSEYWIPLSQVDEIHRDPKTQFGSIVMSDWIADQKGLS